VIYLAFDRLARRFTWPGQDDEAAAAPTTRPEQP
jgi:hypothetical protein